MTTCPTGIDIREGLQLECIACTQCVDACDNVMDKIGKPRGLIRLSSQNNLETGEKTKVFRFRTLLYPAIIAGLLGILGFVVTSAGNADVTILRQLNAPFVVLDGEEVRNQLRVKVVNRSGAERTYRMRIPGVDPSAILAPQFPLRVQDNDSITTPVFITLPKSRFQGGKLPIEVQVEDGEGFETSRRYLLLGPES